MTIEIHELLKLAREAILAEGDPSEFPGSDLILLSPESEALKVLFTLHGFADLEKQGGLESLPESFFDPLASAVMNTLEMHPHFFTDQDNLIWTAVVSVGANLLVQYTRQHADNVDLGYRLAEEIRLFSRECHPEWLYVAIGEFQRGAFNRFSNETLFDMAKNSHALQADMGKENSENHTCIFSGETERQRFHWDDLYTTPFLYNLMQSAMKMTCDDSPKHYRSPRSDLRQGLERVCARLLRFDGSSLKIPCAHVDYLLTGQLIDRFSKLYAVVEDQSKRDSYIRAAAVLIDLVVMDTDMPMDKTLNVYQSRAGGMALIKGGSGELLTREFADLLDGWTDDSPFADEMAKLRKAIVGSTLLAAQSRPGYFNSSSEQDLLRMLNKSRSDLTSPAFHSFIKKQGRLAIADRISDLDDPDLKKSFLKACREVRGHVLENDLGL